jgi:hypothetical protein
MPKIQIISDLHLESPKAYDVFEIIPKAPYLALLGDIGHIVQHKEECLAFLDRQLREFQAVLFVPGNHETYGSTWEETLGALRQFEHDVAQRRNSDATSLGQFALLERNTFELSSNSDEKVVILGCSLFSHIPPQSEMAVEMGLQDFFQTTSWSAHAHNEAHRRDLAWLNDQVGHLQQSDGNVKIVVFTHWSPTRDPRGSDPRHSNSPITPGFATDLSDQPCFNSKSVSLWAFGHTHFNCDFLAERRDATPLRFVTNQRGYYFSQAKGFDAERIVEL